MSTLDIFPIPAWSDNYFWLLWQQKNAVVVDPGSAAEVLAALALRQLTLQAILLTHHHPDHIGGVAELASRTGAKVYGHARDARRLPPLDVALDDGASFEITEAAMRFSAIATPGHTVGHLCYYGMGLLLAGDTLFSGGCGRMFEGTPVQYWQSIAGLRQLPPQTQLLCAHEYTVANLQFAHSLLPHEPAVAQALAAALAKRAQGRATLPSTLGEECQHNLFLRCDEPMLAAVLQCSEPEASAVFQALRRAKDAYRNPST